MTTLILLVGEQPAPNLLPLRYYTPAQVVLVHTRRTAPIAGRLKKVIGTVVVEPLCEVDAYAMPSIADGLRDYITRHGWSGDDLIFNLTGGTKPMALAAYEVARQSGARAFYYQTEDNQSLIHPYHFEQGNLVCETVEPIAATLTLDNYLRLYVGDYDTGKLKEPLEIAVEQTLRRRLPQYEFMPSVRLKKLAGNVEVDLLARNGNQIAAFEIKRQGKKGIDQLNGVTDQRTLGTYTRKILISATPLESNNLELANAYRIRVVTLASAQSGALSQADEDELVRAVQETLEARQ